MRAESISLNREVEALLAEAQLPVSDLSSSRGLNLLGLREGGRLVGVVGVEVHGGIGMLRSLAVEPARRDAGLGVRLVSNAEAWAAERGVRTLYLLTTTAAEFFTRRGYEAISRSEAPAAIAATAQFSDLCPASSTFMRKVLAADNSLNPDGPDGPRG
jgi:amino-acid N-acetyltransferase